MVRYLTLMSKYHILAMGMPHSEGGNRLCTLPKNIDCCSFSVNDGAAGRSLHYSHDNHGEYGSKLHSSLCTTKQGNSVSVSLRSFSITRLG